MGIQAYIKIADLEKLCSQVVLESESFDVYSEDGHWVGMEVHYNTLAKFADGEELWFNTYPDKSGVWIDVNHWGNNRSRYLPVLDKYKVPYTEG
jgi:hypothetical protein